MNNKADNIPECTKNAVLMQSSPLPPETPQVQGNYTFLGYKFCIFVVFIYIFI